MYKIMCMYNFFLIFSLSFEGIVQGRFEVRRHDIIDKIVKVGTINEPLSLVARVHGSPAELVIRSLSLHEAPHRTTHHRNRLLVWHDEKLSCLINVHSLAKELTCKGAIMAISLYKHHDVCVGVLSVLQHACLRNTGLLH